MHFGGGKKGALADQMFAAMAGKKGKAEASDADAEDTEEETEEGGPSDDEYKAEKIAAAKEVREATDDESYADALEAFIKICAE